MIRTDSRKPLCMYGAQTYSCQCLGKHAALLCWLDLVLEHMQVTSGVDSGSQAAPWTQNCRALAIAPKPHYLHTLTPLFIRPRTKAYQPSHFQSHGPAEIPCSGRLGSPCFGRLDSQPSESPRPAAVAAYLGSNGGLGEMRKPHTS